MILATRKKRKQGNLHLKHNTVSQKGITVLIFLAIFVLTYLAVLQTDSVLEVYDEIDVQYHYIEFQNKMEDLIDTGVKLVYGYDAYFMTNADITNEDSEAFLSYLTKNYGNYIRNIGILEDTTIIYNYPMAGNESSIGVDLAQVETQREAVLKVKNELTEVFLGPVDLIQGGQGYIIRVPILDMNGAYWGQASIVLRTDKINEQILTFADEADLNVAIYQSDNATVPIIGDASVKEQDSYRFESSGNIGWIIYATSKEKSHGTGAIKAAIYIVGVLFSLLLSSYYYNSKKSKFRLEYAIYHDQLTDLYNRRYLEIVQQTIARQAVQEKYGYGLLHIDVDNFKYINDTFGHLKGDETLREISRVLKTISRKNELVFRIGGDEFLIMIPKINEDHELEKMRLRYEKDFKEEFTTDTEVHFLGISIGISVFPSEGKDFDEVLKKADFDMYEQKKQHKGLK